MFRLYIKLYNSFFYFVLYLKGHKLNNEDAIRFIFVGNSTSTFLNTKTDNSFTYKVKNAKDSDFNTYIGTISNGLYKHGRKSNILNTTQSVKVFDYVLSNLNKSTLEIWHEGTCSKYGRQLTVPFSITV